MQFDATVPVIADRCHQARVVNALEPEWEARFEPKSYGFRPGRGCHDAIQACFEVAKGRSPKRPWVLDADLAGAFDRIAHDHILAMLGTFPARGMVRQWLKAGVVEQGRLHRTEEGTPQGGVVSPVLLNVALHGMEEAAGVRYLSSGSIRVDSSALIRYADDLVVFCHTRQHALEVKARLASWLASRGLAFNEDKTRVVTLSEGSGRAGARCRRYRRSVSPTRPPNRTCPSPGIRLSAGRAVADRGAGLGNGGFRPGGGLVCSGGRPRRGDSVSAIAVSGHRDLGGPGEPRAFGAGPLDPPVPSPDLFPGQLRVLHAQPSHDSPPQVVAEVREAALARSVAIVVGPSAQDGVEGVDQLIEREVRRVAFGQRLDAVHDRAQRSFTREAIGDVLVGPPGSPLDAEPEQVKAVVYVGDVRFLGRERQSHLLCHELGRLLFDRVGLGFGAAHHHHEVIRLCRVLCYAERLS